MARSIIAAPYRFLSYLITPFQKSAANSETPSATAPENRQIDHLAYNHGDSPKPPSRFVGVPDFADRKRKRNTLDDDFDLPLKKRSLQSEQPDFIPYDDDVDPTVAAPSGRLSIIPFSRSNDVRRKSEKDRNLMPPPATPGRREDPNQRHSQQRAWAQDEDAVSFSSTTMAKRRADDMDDNLMEEARRHAAAISLPPNSGVWSGTERDLFFHLAYRGFEALLPQNWMLDFDTLPISLFAHENTTDPPLVQNVRDNQFRASHALRRLFETGHDLRDRGHVSPSSQPERVLGQAVRRYLDWALTDIGFRPTLDTKYIPVHAIVTRRNGRSTLQTLEDVAMKLHGLSVRHQQAQDIQPSIESHDPSGSDAEGTRVVKDDESSPTFIGLVIISSVIAIVTLSPFSTLPFTSPPSVRQTESPPHSDPDSSISFNPDRLRIIAELDFSQKDQDVWNALGVAIVAMEIRKAALKANFGMSSEDYDTLVGQGDLSAKTRFEDNFDNKVGNSSSLELQDDPDL